MSVRPASRSLILAFTALLACAHVARAQAQTAVADPDPARFAQEIQQFQDWDRKNTVPSNAVLFVGSSSIRFWPTAERLPSLPVINRGFGGSRISDVLHYLRETVLAYDANVIVFYAGDNDLAAGKSPERVAADYRTFVERVLAARPGVRIVFISIKPSLQRWDIWPLMQQTNALIKAFSATRPNLSFVDVGTPMLGADGKPNPALFIADGLHMTPAGYDIWTRLAGQAIAAALAAPAR